MNTTYEYAGLISPWWCAGFLIACFIVCILGICTMEYDNIQKILITIALILLVCIVTCLVLTLIKTDEIIEIQHDITISDEVNFNEFYEKYEVIEQKGKIFTD